MKEREIGNMALHLTVGGILAGLVYISHWFLVFDTFIYASLREQAQHRWILTPRGQHAIDRYTLYQAEKRIFFDFSWLGWRQVWEIAQWVIGAVVACTVREIFS